MAFLPLTYIFCINVCSCRCTDKWYIHFRDNLIGQIFHTTTCYIYSQLSTSNWMAHYCHQVYEVRSTLSGVHSPHIPYLCMDSLVHLIDMPNMVCVYASISAFIISSDLSVNHCSLWGSFTRVEVPIALLQNPPSG